MIGFLASEFGGKPFHVRVMKSNGGYYIGTSDENGFPFSRESEEYFPSEEVAQGALTLGNWTQRYNP